MTVEILLTLDLDAVTTETDAFAGAVRDRAEEAYREFIGTLENLGLELVVRRADCAMVFVEAEESPRPCEPCRAGWHNGCSGFRGNGNARHECECQDSVHAAVVAAS